MGEHEGWSEPVGQFLNGLLAVQGPVVRPLDAERWLRAEERTKELISCIQPNPQSEERRNAVADYVQQLITKCFPCQVCTFGSVPLKTYLPDGDIDLTAFSLDQNLKDTWANQVRDMLEKEEKNENAEFHVKEVQYIQAEVKIIKCLVENIVVDISFNQVGGLCTLCFLEEVDNMIGQNHLFKRSIILIKAWCYYESRILGATHGLISTYALETLVLYIFHVFNNSLQGPLEVLYRFLEFFSNFDWDRFCVSLWGPVPISSLPAMTAEHPRKDSGELLFTKDFLNSCSYVYAVFPAVQENNGQQFVSKHFNVIDPLRVTNNLGRSVSKGNFYRIRSALAFGAKRLARLFDCPKEDVVFEVNQFFMNTWERHGSGQRPDAAALDPRRTSLPTPDVRDSQTSNNEASRKKTNENISTSGVVVDGGIHRVVSSQYRDGSARMMPKGEVAVTSHLPSLNNQNPPEAQRDVKQNHLVDDSHGRFLFARTRSSPELTDATNASSQLRHNRQVESVNSHGPARPDANNRKKNVASVDLATHTHHSTAKDASSVGNAPYLTGLDGVSANSNSRHHDSISDNLNEKFTSMAGSHMDQEEQDIVNMMASASLKGFNGQLHVPFGLSSAHIPFSMPPSFLASMGYTQRNLPGFIPSNIPPMDAPFSNVQYAHGFVSPQLSHHFPGVGVNSPRDASFDQNNENLSSADMKAVEGDDDFWKEEGVLSSSGYESENGNGDVPVTDHKPQAPVSALKYIPPSRQSGSVRATKVQQRHMRERGGSAGQNSDGLSNLDDIGSDLYAEERSVSSRFSSVSRSNSVRSRTSSESSWDGSSIRTPKSSKERRLKRILSADQGPARGKGKVMSENLPNHAEPDGQGWVSSSDIGEIVEMSSRPENAESLQAPRHYMPSLDVSQASAVDSMIPFAPMLIGRGSRQKSNDSSGMVAFYPTGPPIPFFTMLPLYNIPETESSEAPSGHFAGEEDPDANESKQDFSSERLNELEVSSHSSSMRGRTSETSETNKADILHSDFDSHWQSLQFGRLCQNPRYPGPLVHPSPAMAPPVYFPGPIPYESSGRPPSANLNLSQFMANYGRHLVPVAPLQPVSNRPPNVYLQHIDEIPRYRSGTGTYLPNPKVAIRERHSSGGRRGNYRDDRSDLYGDRDGNWNANTKSRGGMRNHNRNQNDKKVDRMVSTESGTDNSWNSYRHEPTPPYPMQNGPLSSNSSQNGSQNANYSSYPLAAMSPNALSNGPVPPVVMFYPFSNNAGYGGEQLEFGSLGPLGFHATEDQLQLNEGSRARVFDDHRIHANSGHWSSPDQPSSPHYQSHRSRERG